MLFRSVLLFLMKLAIFKENLGALREKPKDANPKDKTALPQLITALTTFVPHTTEPLVATALRLLFNLSFDAQLRSAIVSPNGGFLPKLASLLKRKQQLRRPHKLMHKPTLQRMHQNKQMRMHQRRLRTKLMPMPRQKQPRKRRRMQRSLRARRHRARLRRMLMPKRKRKQRQRRMIQPRQMLTEALSQVLDRPQVRSAM